MRVRFALILLVGLACSALARAADPFAGFRIPAHGWRSGTVNLDLSRDGSRYTSGDIRSNRSMDSRGRLLGRLSQSWDSEALLWKLSASALGDLTGTRDESGDGQGPVSLGVISRSQLSDQVWEASGDAFVHPWAGPVGFDLAARVAGTYAQSWYSDREHDVYPGAYRNVLDQNGVTRTHSGFHTVSLSGSVGLGRMRDATPVMDVHVIERRLLEAGALVRPLSPAARERLAALEATAPSLAAVLDRPDRRLWREIETVLRTDGALSDRGLDAYALVRAREPVRFATTRTVGWFVGPALTLSHERYHWAGTTERSAFASGSGAPPDTLFDERAGSRVNRRFDSAWLGGTAVYHRPLGWDWQLDLGGAIAGPVRPGDSGLQAAAFAEMTWYFADRWQAAASLNDHRTYYQPRGGRGDPIPSEWLLHYDATIGYYLEDHVLLQLALEEYQVRQREQFGSHDYQRQNRVSLSATYRFLGRIEAPGLFDATQPGR